MSRYLTPGQLAALLTLKEDTIRSWRYRGGGPPFIRIRGAIRYREDDVEAWLAANTHRNTGEYTANCEA